MVCWPVSPKMRRRSERSMISMPSSDQPCEAANVASSSSVSEKATRRVGSCRATPSLEELKRQRRLARTRFAFQQIEAGHGQSAHQNTIQAVDTGGQTWRRDRFGHGNPRW